MRALEVKVRAIDASGVVDVPFVVHVVHFGCPDVAAAAGGVVGPDLLAGAVFEAVEGRRAGHLDVFPGGGDEVVVAIVIDDVRVASIVVPERIGIVRCGGEGEEGS